MPKKPIEIASEMVQTQVSRTPMSGAEIASSLRQVFSTLHELQKAEAGGIESCVRYMEWKKPFNLLSCTLSAHPAYTEDKRGQRSSR